MQTVYLGQSGLRVSPLCLGCMSFGEPGGVRQPWSLAQDDARPFFRRAIEAGRGVHVDWARDTSVGVGLGGALEDRGRRAIGAAGEEDRGDE